MNRMRQHLNDHAIKIWNACDAKQLVERHFPEYLTIFEAAPRIMQIDMIRYMILHQEGGVYLDADIKVLKPLGPLLDGQEAVFMVETLISEHYANAVAGEPIRNGLPEDLRRIANYAMASRPGHPVWIEVLKEMKARIDRQAIPVRQYDVLYLTGPDLLSHCVNRYPTTGISVIGLDASRAHFKHLQMGSWRKEYEGGDLDSHLNGAADIVRPPANAPASHYRSTEAVIPRIIHQTWADHELPSSLQKTQERIRRLHPDHEYLFWTDSDLRGFIKQHYLPILHFYDALPKKIQQIDLARLLLVYHFGGLYLDMDYWVIKPLDGLLGSENCLFGLEPEAHAKRHGMQKIVSNAFFAATPRHPFIKALIDGIIERKSTRSVRHPSYVLESTGPFLTTAIYERLGSLLNARILDAETMSPLSMAEVDILLSRGSFETLETSTKAQSAFGIHLYQGTWWRSGKLLKKPSLGNWRHSVRSNARHRVRDFSEYPMISAIMVTQNSMGLVEQSVRCFQSQTYPNKELVILHQAGSPHKDRLLGFGRDTSIRLIECPAMPKNKLDLLRNQALGKVSGRYIVQWNEDAWHHPEHMTRMLAVLYEHEYLASVLGNWFAINRSSQKLELSTSRLPEGSILFDRSWLENADRTEREGGRDSPFMHCGQSNMKQATMPYLYLYRGHGEDTRSAADHAKPVRMRMKRVATSAPGKKGVDAYVELDDLLVNGQAEKIARILESISQDLSGTRRGLSSHGAASKKPSVAQWAILGFLTRLLSSARDSGR